jgi:hypothetical protein
MIAISEARVSWTFISKGSIALKFKATLDQLNPHLAAHLRSNSGYYVIDHPFVRIGPLNLTKLLEGIAAANDAYELKRKQVEEACENDSWMEFVLLHERAWRPNALMSAIEWNDGEMLHLWPVVGFVWRDSENIRHFHKEWRQIWSTTCRRRKFVMDQKERAKLSRLPNELTVWRGTSHQAAIQGFSWTINRSKAIWFAHRDAVSSASPLLAHGRIAKENICAYFVGRNEEEIVALPEHVSLNQVERLAMSSSVLSRA